MEKIIKLLEDISVNGIVYRKDTYIMKDELGRIYNAITEGEISHIIPLGATLISRDQSLLVWTKALEQVFEHGLQQKEAELKMPEFGFKKITLTEPILIKGHFYCSEGNIVTKNGRLVTVSNPSCKSYTPLNGILGLRVWEQAVIQEENQKIKEYANRESSILDWIRFTNLFFNEERCNCKEEKSEKKQPKPEVERTIILTDTIGLKGIPFYKKGDILKKDKDGLIFLKFHDDICDRFIKLSNQGVYSADAIWEKAIEQEAKAKTPEPKIVKQITITENQTGEIEVKIEPAPMEVFEYRNFLNSAILGINKCLSLLPPEKDLNQIIYEKFFKEIDEINEREKTK